MVFPIESFGFRLIRSFKDANDVMTYEFGKDTITFCIKKGDKYDYNYFNQFLSLQSDSFCEALQQTIDMVNDV